METKPKLMNLKTLQRLLGVFAIIAAGYASAQIHLYNDENLRRRTMSIDQPIDNLGDTGMNDKASSILIDDGNWEVCEDAAFCGKCTLLRPGKYSSLRAMGFNDMISSVRPMGGFRRSPPAAPQAAAPAPVFVLAAPPEQPAPVALQAPPIYEALVLSVRTIVSPPNQRCRIEQRRGVDEAVCENLPGNAREIYEVRYYLRANLLTTHMLVQPGASIAVNESGYPIR